MLFVVLGWAITEVVDCSVVLAYAVCDVLGYKRGAWLFGCLGCSVFGVMLDAWLFGCLGCSVFGAWLGSGWAVRVLWVVQFVGV